MTQVKLFTGSDINALEKVVNKFLKEIYESTGHGSNDIKITTAPSQIGYRYTVLICYDVASVQN